MVGRRSELRIESVWLLVVAVALIPLAWFPPSPLGSAQLSDAVGAGGVLLALLAARSYLAARDRAAELAWRGPTIAMGTYAAWAAVSMLATNGSRMRLIGTWWLVALAIGAAAYALQSESHATRLRRALVAAAVLGALTGVAGAVLFAFDTPTALLNHAGDLVPGHYPRIRGTMMRANGLAGLLAIGLLLLGDVPRRWRVPIGALLGIALVFTFSRSWIALAGAAIVYVLALGERRSTMRDVAAIVAVIGAVGVMLAVSWLDVRLDPTRPWALEIAADAGTRWIHLRDALDTIAAHPVTGIGPGASAALGWDAHFTIFQVAALMGIPAAVAFVSLVALAVSRAVRAARGGDRGARGVAAALVLCCIDALARDIEDQRAFWVLLGLALVTKVVVKPR